MERTISSRDSRYGRNPSRSSAWTLTQSAWPSRIHMAAPPRPPSASLRWLTCVSSWAKSPFQEMHACEAIAPQEQANPRGDAPGEAPLIPGVLARLVGDLDEPVDECRLVDVDVRLGAHREGKIKLVAHHPGDRVDQVGVTRALAERRRLSDEPNLVFPIRTRSARRPPCHGHEDQQDKPGERKPRSPSAIIS